MTKHDTPIGDIFGLIVAGCYVVTVCTIFATACIA